MRYRVRVVRAQTSERTIRAGDEEAAIEKVRAELSEPYGWIGRWETVATEIDVVAESSPVMGLNTDIGEGALLVSVKEAPKLLGISAGRVYEPASTGEIETVHLGRRRMISRETLARFIEANTRSGS